MSSPRPWRCFQNESTCELTASVFSTPVEVFPLTGQLTEAQERLLHARGGVSTA